MNLKPPSFLTNFQQAIISPIPAKIEVFDTILPKLQQKEPDFKLKKPASVIPSAQAATKLDELKAYGAVDFETGEVLAEKDLDKRVPIASITKVMTSVVALDLASPDDLFTVSERASKMIPTKLNLKPGDKLTLNELLRGALMVSANDFAQVIKEGIEQKYGGEVFVRAMNEKAKFLGMGNTKYTNPSGLDGGDPYSTVEDQAILMHYALNNYPLIAEIVKKDYDFLPETELHGSQRMNNWNGLIGVYPGIYGIKIGNTDNAKQTTAVVSQRNGKKVLAIVLGAPGVVERDLYAAELLDLGFQKLAGINPIGVTEEQLRAKYSTWRY